MTGADMAEAVRLAQAFDDANSSVMLMSHALTIARALLESRRQVEALTSVLDAIAAAVDAFEGNQPPQYAPGEYDHAALAKTAASVIRDDSTSALGLADRLRAERAAATVRAERAERELAVIKAACPTSTVLTEHCRCGSGAHPRECKRHPFAYETHVASMDAEAREVAVAVTTERARLVEAIAAWHDEAARIDGEHGNSFQAYAHALSAAYLRSHNWTPPEEESK